MYMYVWLYNTLNRWVRRKNMAIYYFTGAMTMIPVGFAIFLWGMDKNNNTNLYGGAILILLSIVLWIVSLRKATTERREEKKERDNQLQVIIDALNRIAPK